MSLLIIDLNFNIRLINMQMVLELKYHVKVHISTFITFNSRMYIERNERDTKQSIFLSHN